MMWIFGDECFQTFVSFLCACFLGKESVWLCRRGGVIFCACLYLIQGGSNYKLINLPIQYIPTYRHYSEFNSLAIYVLRTNA